ncbi:hypothetical protein HPB52_025157 [Rhipicephalus sanguineus]|uniref:Uncharacterized protein n=1 Tax=Rhipicephalus sanguineus TaxID=34632 RepID=A0A9D4YRR3_RHISA|nr:hypothetical protein HPB52_025157 [Rhipicephalus sanguineus]
MVYLRRLKGASLECRSPPRPSGLLLRSKRKTLSREMLPNARRSSCSCNGSIILHDDGLQDRRAPRAVSADGVHLLVCQISFTGTMSALVVKWCLL